MATIASSNSIFSAPCLAAGRERQANRSTGCRLLVCYASQPPADWATAAATFTAATYFPTLGERGPALSNRDQDPLPSKPALCKGFTQREPGSATPVLSWTPTGRNAKGSGFDRLHTA
jgi:hypothetical protein